MTPTPSSLDHIPEIDCYSDEDEFDGILERFAAARAAYLAGQPSEAAAHPPTVPAPEPLKTEN